VAGNRHVLEPLRALYRKRTGSAKGFQEYLDKKRADQRPRPPVTPNPAKTTKPPAPKPAVPKSK